MELQSGDGYVEFTITDTASARMIGFNRGDANQNYTDIDFAIHSTGGTRARVREWKLSRELRVIRAGRPPPRGNRGWRRRVQEERHPPLHELGHPQYPLLVDTAFYTSASTIADVTLVGTLGPPQVSTPTFTPPRARIRQRSRSRSPARWGASRSGTSPTGPSPRRARLVRESLVRRHLDHGEGEGLEGRPTDERDIYRHLHDELRHAGRAHRQPGVRHLHEFDFPHDVVRRGRHDPIHHEWHGAHGCFADLLRAGAGRSHGDDQSEDLHPDYVASATTTRTYTIKVATPTFSPDGGTYTAGQSTIVEDATTGASIHYTIAGSDPVAGDSAVSSGAALALGNFTLKARAFKAGCDRAGSSRPPSTRLQGRLRARWSRRAAPTRWPCGATAQSGRGATTATRAAGGWHHQLQDPAGSRRRSHRGEGGCRRIQPHASPKSRRNRVGMGVQRVRAARGRHHQRALPPRFGDGAERDRRDFGGSRRVPLAGAQERRNRLRLGIQPVRPAG